MPAGLLSSRAPMVVELVGPAGVGKSTLVGALSGRGLVEERTIWGQPVLPLLTTGLQLLPLLSQFWRQSRTPLWDEARHIVRLKNLSLAVRQEKRAQARTMIFDEGPIFALAWLRGFGHQSIRSEAAEIWWRATLREWAEVMDAVVVLDAPDQVLIHRIRARAHPHEVKELPDQEIVRWMARFRGALEWVLSEMARHGGSLVVRLAADLPPERIAEQLADALNERRQRAG